MNKIIAALLFLFIGISGMAQEKLPYFGLTDYDNNYTVKYEAVIYPDSSIYIEGDTVEVVKRLLLYIKDQNKRIGIKDDAIEACVNYINRLPERYHKQRTNCMYNEYLYAIRKDGYDKLPSDYKLPECKTNTNQ